MNDQPALLSRYSQLLGLVDEAAPGVIVEIGVARTVRAREMSEHALEKGWPVHYIGYDVFETADDEFHKAAYNHKRVEPAHWCERKLDHVKKRWPLFTFNLVIGDTRQTLHGKIVEADFAFIDGDHRVETILGDYIALSACQVIALDDYYEADERGMPDVSKFGCNQVVDGLRSNPDLTVEILPVAEAGKYQGRSRIAVVRRK